MTVDQAEAQIVDIGMVERWEAYRRLQELEIPCFCSTNQPLQVHIQTVTAAVQVWSITRQLTTPRHRLAYWLERCLLATDTEPEPN